MIQILKAALDWCNSPHVTVLATPPLIATARLIRLQIEQQECVTIHGHGGLVVVLKGRNISMHNSHCHLTCPD